MDGWDLSFISITLTIMCLCVCALCLRNQIICVIHWSEQDKVGNSNFTAVRMHISNPLDDDDRPNLFHPVKGRTSP